MNKQLILILFLVGFFTKALVQPSYFSQTVWPIGAYSLLSADINQDGEIDLLTDGYWLENDDDKNIQPFWPDSL